MALEGINPLEYGQQVPVITMALMPVSGPTQFANPNLGWEKQAMFNVGVDFGFFDNRLYGTVEFFNKTSKDLLYNFPLPSSHGITSIMMNLAKVKNYGVEVELGGDIIKTGDWL